MEIMRMIANRQIYPVYQPIIDASKNTAIGYEALDRSPKNTKSMLVRWYKEYQKTGGLHEQYIKHPTYPRPDANCCQLFSSAILLNWEGLNILV